VANNGMCIPQTPKKWMDGPLKRVDGTVTEDRYLPWIPKEDEEMRKGGVVLCEHCKMRQSADRLISPMIWQKPIEWDSELRFVRNQDLTNDTMELIPQLPNNVIGVIGIPVSGMIPAAYLSRMLCVPLYSFDYKEGVVSVGDGRRGRSVSQKDGVYVVVDDTVYSGGEMKKARAAMKKLGLECVFAAVYTKDPKAVDIYSVYAPGSVILEWNIFNSGNLSGRSIMPECKGGICTDFDGVICEEPPVNDLRQPDQFQWWLANARPQYLPRKVAVPLIVSFRIEPWRAVTEAWMARWGVRTKQLVLHPSQTIQERNRTHSVAEHKGKLFRDSPCLIMFESDERQARTIADASGKLVIVPSTGKIIRPDQFQSPRRSVSAPVIGRRVAVPSDHDNLMTWFKPGEWKSPVIMESAPVHEFKQQDVTVYAIISTWHEADIVEAAVKNCFAHGCERVFIVDNDSPDETRERAIAAGAEIGVNFHTDMYQEQVRIGHINHVMHEITKEMCLPRLWWLTVDCDEFIQVPGGRTLKQFLERLGPECNVVGTKCIDHYPDRPLANIRGFHPAEFQPMGWFRGSRVFCAVGHWKHPLVCMEAGEPSMIQTRGLHKPFVFHHMERSGLVGPKECLWLHHFPFRNEDDTRERLGVLCKPNDLLGGVHRSIPDDKQLGGEGAIKRYRSLDAIYSYQWDKVELPHAQVTKQKIGVPVVHYSKFMSDDEYRPLRWYAENELESAVADSNAAALSHATCSGLNDGLSLTQFLCFEVGSKCNLDEQHKGRCPSADVDRYGNMDVANTLDDDTIVECVKYAYANGFTGEIGWHYYNEPLLQWGRIRSLIGRIRLDVPQSRFILWTNGTQIGTSVDPAELHVFEDVWVSNYFNQDWKRIFADVPVKLHVLDGKLDGRKTLLAIPTGSPCMRPFNEIVVDNHGNMHLCCADWKGDAGIGNVLTDGLEACLEKFFQTRADAAASPMRSCVPEICKRCTIRESSPGRLVPDVYERIVNVRKSPPQR